MATYPSFNELVGMGCPVVEEYGQFGPPHKPSPQYAQEDDWGLVVVVACHSVVVVEVVRVLVGEEPKEDLKNIFWENIVYFCC